MYYHFNNTLQSLKKPAANKQVGIWHYLREPPSDLKRESGPKPLYVETPDGEEYFAITLYGKGLSTYKYNFENDQFAKIPPAYPNNISPIYHGNAIDINTNQLYIFGGDKRIFATLNYSYYNTNLTLDNAWNVKCPDYKTGFMSKFGQNNKLHAKYGLDKINLDRPESIFIPAFNELHLFVNDNNEKQGIDLVFHIIYDMKHEKFIHVYTFENFKLFPASPILYNETQRRIILFGGFETKSYKSQIYFCDLGQPSTSSSQQCLVTESKREYKWELFQTILPRQSNYFDVVLGIFNFVAIVFYFSSYDCKDIWCYDMQENKWYKSQHKYPSDKGKTFVIKTNNDWVHFIDFTEMNHFKVKVLDLLPKLLSQRFSVKFECLVYGYCKEIGQTIRNQIVPLDIIKLIFRYHPLLSEINDHE